VCNQPGIECSEEGRAKESCEQQARAEQQPPDVAEASNRDFNDRGFRPSYILEPLGVGPSCRTFDIDFYEDGLTAEKVSEYWKLCKNSEHLVVTTSCFTAWRANKKTNGYAKVIPAIPFGVPENVRVFFFDDNINLSIGGSSGVAGICNLRDITTGEYVDFSAGKNGFAHDCMFLHTAIHYSTTYRNVLVQANILDALRHAEYFKTIVKKFVQEGEKIVVFMDVNGTIVWDDTLAKQSSAETLLTTMFRLVRVVPRNPFELVWESQPVVHVQEQIHLKSLVSEVSNNDNEFHINFWNYPTCRKFIKTVIEFADLHWHQSGDIVTEDEFFTIYADYLRQFESYSTHDRIARSWYDIYNFIRYSGGAGHAVILNTFGVDSRKIIMNTLTDESTVLHLTVDYRTWGDRDVKAWTDQFAFARCGTTLPKGRPKLWDRMTILLPKWGTAPKGTAPPSSRRFPKFCGRAPALPPARCVRPKDVAQPSEKVRPKFFCRVAALAPVWCWRRRVHCSPVVEEPEWPEPVAVMPTVCCTAPNSLRGG